MNYSELKNGLVERNKKVLKTMAQIEKMRQKEPIGRLRLSIKSDHVEYYHVVDKNQTRGKYLGKKEYELAKALAQKDYIYRLEKRLLEEYKALEKILAVYDDEVGEEVFSNQIKERQNLISPILITDEEYAKRWLEEAFESNPFRTEELIYETDRGDFVRTKTERDIANIYYELRIPYKYECALVLNDGRVKYPDFTLLDVKRRRIIYHEHLGLLDKEEYRIENLQKIDKYREAGIYTGKNLIITHDTKYSPINLKQTRKMLREIFMG